jgi:hypothetical protein
MPTSFACLLGVLCFGEGIRVAGLTGFAVILHQAWFKDDGQTFGVMKKGEPVNGRHVWITKAFWG